MFGSVDKVGTKALQIINAIDRDGKYEVTPSVFQPYIENGKDYINLFNKYTGNYEKIQVANGTAVLQKDEWLEIDTAVQMATKQDLHFVSDLMGAGLSRNFDGLSCSGFKYESAIGLSDAERHMRPNVTTQSENIIYTDNTIPLPFVSKDYPINLRLLRESRKSGMGLDVLGVQEATYQVLKNVEDLFVSATAYKAGGNSVMGLQHTTGVYTYDGSHQWTAYPTTTGQSIVSDVIAAVEILRIDGWPGPYWVYVPSGTGYVLDNDYTTGAVGAIATTIRNRILQIEGVEKVSTLQGLTAAKPVVMSASPGSVRALNGLSPTVFQWEEMGGLGLTLRVSAIMAPQFILKMTPGLAVNSGVATLHKGVVVIDGTN